VSELSPLADQDLGLRERQKRARREALVDAAHHLVGERGLDAVSVEDICAEAGVSRRTFFNYFSSKDDAVLAIEPWELAPEDVRAFADGGPTGRLFDDLAELARLVLASRTVGRDRVGRALELARQEPRLSARQLAAFDEHRHTMLELIRERLGPEAAAVDVELAAMTTMTLAHAALVRWEAHGRTGAVAPHVDAVALAFKDVVR